MYTYEKEVEKPVSVHANPIRKSASPVQNVSVPAYNLSADIRYRKLPVGVRQKAVIQCIKETDFQRAGRQVSIVNKGTLNMDSKSTETQRIKESPILAEGIFETLKSAKANELVSLAAGKNYLQLGWDSCILFQQAEEGKYRVKQTWVMDEDSVKEGELIYRNLQHSGSLPPEEVSEADETPPEEVSEADETPPEEVSEADETPPVEVSMLAEETTSETTESAGEQPQQEMQSAGQVVDSLITWSVSSCEIVILVSEDKKNIAVMHIDKHAHLPWNILKNEKDEEQKVIKWKTAFVSMLDDVDELARTQELLNELNPDEIKILDRGDITNFAENSHPYIGMNLTGENSPQVFGVQGDKAPVNVDARINMIWEAQSWIDAKLVLPGYQSIIDLLEGLLLSINQTETAGSEDRNTILETNFQRLKNGESIFTRFRRFFDKGNTTHPDYRAIFENIVRNGLAEQEQPFLTRL